MTSAFCYFRGPDIFAKPTQFSQIDALAVTDGCLIAPPHVSNTWIRCDLQAAAGQLMYAFFHATLLALRCLRGLLHNFIVIALKSV